MKKLLATLCLFLLGSLSVSVFSPGIHNSLFHGGSECAHGHSQLPCTGHGDNSSDERDSESCAVVLFGKSVDTAVAFDPKATPSFLLEEILPLYNKIVERSANRSKRWARGPPSLF